MKYYKPSNISTTTSTTHISAGYPLEFYTFIWVPICMYTFGIQTTRHIYLCTCTTCTVDACFLIISELRTRHLNEIFSSTKLFQAFRAVPKIGSIFTTNFSKR